jgi:hypothetical protein
MSTERVSQAASSILKSRCSCCGWIAILNRRPTRGIVHRIFVASPSQKSGRWSGPGLWRVVGVKVWGSDYTCPCIVEDDLTSLLRYTAVGSYLVPLRSLLNAQALLRPRISTRSVWMGVDAYGGGGRRFSSVSINSCLQVGLRDHVCKTEGGFSNSALQATCPTRPSHSYSTLSDLTVDLA